MDGLCRILIFTKHTTQHNARQIQEVTAELEQRAEAERRKREARLYVVWWWWSDASHMCYRGG